MIIHIPGYHLGHRIFSLALSESAKKELDVKNFDYLCIYKNALFAYPGEVYITNDSEVIEKISVCAEYSVFEVSDNGNAFLYYDADSLDNAFIITGKCNSNCVMCPDNEYVRSHGRTADIQTLLTIVDYIPYHENHFTITGGEPFLLGKDIFRLFSALKNKFSCAEYLLLTNGRIFSVPEYAQLLASTIPEKTLIGIPIHGYDDSSHDSITQAPGSFKQTIAGIKHLLSFGLHVEIRIVVSKISAPFISKIADLIVSEFPSIDCVKVMGIEMLGNARINQHELWIPYQKAFAESKNAIHNLLIHGIDVALYNFPLCAVDKEYWHIAKKSISEWKIRYGEKCFTCHVKDACGGLFAGSYRFAENDLVPVLEE